LTARAVLRSGDGRLRAPWRLLLFGVFTLVLAFIGLAIVGVLLPDVTPSDGTATDELLGASSIAATWAIVAALGGAHWLSLRFVERRDWDYVWLDRTAAQPAPLLGGFLIGALAVGIPSVLLVAAGWLDIIDVPGAWHRDVAAVVMLLLPAALLEELMLRGYPLAVLRDALGWRAAILLTSVVFGALHAFNPNVGVLAIGIVTVAGLFLGTVVFVFRSLWTATAAHFAWNFTLAVLLHAAVSGQEFPAGDYRVVDDGPDWVTGGAWGPEGGAAAITGMLVATVGLLRRRRPDLDRSA
jgi:uncharacterized protein